MTELTPDAKNAEYWRNEAARLEKKLESKELELKSLEQRHHDALKYLDDAFVKLGFRYL